MDTTADVMYDLFNSEGFLRDPRKWDSNIAAVIARQDGLPPLTAAHWAIINALRAHFLAFGAAPPAFSHICLINHMSKHCVEHLFHSQREAWRIAGLPDPGEEAKTYMQ